MEIELPEPLEALVETEWGNARPCLAEALAPLGEGAGIVLAEDALRRQFQALPSADFLQLAGRRQHAAGEDVALDEIGAPGIVLEHGVLDRDDLQARKPAGLQAGRHLVEIDRPVFLADRLEHFDGGDPVVNAGFIAVILKDDLDLVIEAGLEDALAGIVILLAGNGQGAHIGADLAGRKLGKAAPAAADFQHLVARLDAGGLRQRQIFLALCLFQRGGALVEQGRGIGHRRVEPFPVESVAKVVMRRDVPLRALAGVAVEPVAQRDGQAEQRAALQLLHRRVPVDAEEF